jgi:hypothetical protein
MEMKWIEKGSYFLVVVRLAAGAFLAVVALFGVAGRFTAGFLTVVDFLATVRGLAVSVARSLSTAAVRFSTFLVRV